MDKIKPDTSLPDQLKDRTVSEVKTHLLPVGQEGDWPASGEKKTSWEIHVHIIVLVIRAVAIAWFHPETKRYRANYDDLFEEWFERLQLAFHINRTDVTVLLVRIVRGKHEKGQVAGIAFFYIRRSGAVDRNRSGSLLLLQYFSSSV